MSEMTSAVETQQQQQQYVGGGSNAEHHCKDCGLNFESEKSLEVHLHYHQENLLNQWANKAQQEESNNNHSKTGNHNSHVSVNRDGVPADSSEPSSMSPSQDPTSSQQQIQQQQSQQQPQQQPPTIHTIVCPQYDHFRASMFSDSGYFMQNDTYILPHHYSPSEEGQSNGGRDGSYIPRYHPYQHQQLYSSDRATSNSTSPQSPPFHCDKCGIVYEDANQLGEHMRTNHLDSPTAYPSAPQYQQLGNSPQQQGQQLHSSPPLSSQPQSGYDYNGGQTIKSEMKQEQPEEQAEILDLDSHKVQTHRYEEQQIMRMRQQELQLQMHQVIQQQQSQRVESLPVSSMLNWQTIQTHDYHAGHPSMGPINNVPPIADQDQFMRGQHMPVDHGHQGSSIITSTQPMSGHQMPAAGFVQQTPKAPLANQSWKSNEPRRPKTYNCTACNKWFTSSGHLKRHYNTTLHKNAVKNGKEPDPANLPITAHHHPTRENNAGHSSGRSGGAPARSPPELSSRSPPNLMAGLSGEATRGLLHTPTTLCNNNSNSSNSSSESLAAVLAQQQHQQQQLVHVGIINSPLSSPLAGHHQQQMGTAPHQLGLQQQQQQPHLPMDSSGQPVHHSTTSPNMHPPAASHMNCPSPMGSSSHPVHHMNSPGSVHPAMTSPTAMGGITMPPQPYPNALPPHVTITTSIPAPLESTQAATTMQLVTIGNEQNEGPRVLPGFRTIMPNFTEFGFVLEPNQTQAINVGGLSVEEIAPQESFESSASGYDPYSVRYKPLTNADMMTLQMNTSNIIEQEVEIICCDFDRVDIANNNHLMRLGQAKEDLDPNVGLVQKSLVKKVRKRKGSNKQCQIRTLHANFISRDGIHKCLDCDKYFNKACYLTQHNKSFHSGDKPFKCGQCGKRYPTEEKYERHTEMHAMARKHKCDSCPKIFAHKTDLKRHICIHTGKRPFKCETCGKGFIRQDHMKKHQDTHNKKLRQNAQREAAQRLNNSRANAQHPNTNNVQQPNTNNVQQPNTNNVQQPNTQQLQFDVNAVKY